MYWEMRGGLPSSDSVLSTSQVLKQSSLYRHTAGKRNAVITAALFIRSVTAVIGQVTLCVDFVRTLPTLALEGVVSADINPCAETMMHLK